MRRALAPSLTNRALVARAPAPGPDPDGSPRAFGAVPAPRRIRARSLRAALGTGRASRAPSRVAVASVASCVAAVRVPVVLPLGHHRLRRLRPSRVSRGGRTVRRPNPGPRRAFALGALATRGIRAPRGLAPRAGGTLQRVNLAGESTAAEERRGRLPLAVIDAEEEARDDGEAPEEGPTDSPMLSPRAILPLHRRTPRARAFVLVVTPPVINSLPRRSRDFRVRTLKIIRVPSRCGSARRRDGAFPGVPSGTVNTREDAGVGH